jgi:non-reducing end alpha-L-arabinofuranosidase
MSCSLISAVLITLNHVPSAPYAALRTCDIYDAAATPCVAAFSTVRALYASYNGPLYRIRRQSDNTTTAVGVAIRGGVADSATQDAFCEGTTCVVESLVDQSAFGNHLVTAPGGQNNGSYDVGVEAGRAPLTMANGKRVYGAYFERGAPAGIEPDIHRLPIASRPILACVSDLSLY